MMGYTDFIKTKELKFESVGFVPSEKLNSYLFDWQRDIVTWALKKGRACLFEDCGLGKTIQQLEWANQVVLNTGRSVLILAPLAVSEQTIREGQKFGIKVIEYCGETEHPVIQINNYEQLHNIDPSIFSGIVLDESSILKSFSGKYRNLIIDSFRTTPFKLACSATPSPNDYMELGNHAEFLGVMSYSEMLSMFFINDSGDVGKWRLKKHAKEKEFWKWLASWAIMITSPADIGYDSFGFDLPPLRFIEHKIPYIGKNIGFFVELAQTMPDRRQVRKESIKKRCEKVAEIVNASNEQWVIWCDLNAESSMLSNLIHNSKEIHGGTDYELRKKWMLGFSEGSVQKLITKPSIGGFGMNWQNCHNIIYTGLSDSWEKFYQSSRRVWRFGQLQSVNCHIVFEEREGKVIQNIKRKDKQAIHMMKSMVLATNELTKSNLKKIEEPKLNNYKPVILPKWIL